MARSVKKASAIVSHAEPSPSMPSRMEVWVSVELSRFVPRQCVRSYIPLEIQRIRVFFFFAIFHPMHSKWTVSKTEFVIRRLISVYRFFCLSRRRSQPYITSRSQFESIAKVPESKYRQ